MTTDLIPILQDLRTMAMLLVLAVFVIIILFEFALNKLNEIRNELKNLVAETAYLATIEDDDEREGK